MTKSWNKAKESRLEKKNTKPLKFDFLREGVFWGYVVPYCISDSAEPCRKPVPGQNKTTDKAGELNEAVERSGKLPTLGQDDGQNRTRTFERPVFSRASRRTHAHYDVKVSHACHCHIHSEQRFSNNLVTQGVSRTRTMAPGGRQLLWMASICWIASLMSGGECWESIALYADIAWPKKSKVSQFESGISHHTLECTARKVIYIWGELSPYPMLYTLLRK